MYYLYWISQTRVLGFQQRLEKTMTAEAQDQDQDESLDQELHNTSPSSDEEMPRATVPQCRLLAPATMIDTQQTTQYLGVIDIALRC